MYSWGRTFFWSHFGATVRVLDNLVTFAFFWYQISLAASLYGAIWLWFDLFGTYWWNMLIVMVRMIEPNCCLYSAIYTWVYWLNSSANEEPNTGYCIDKPCPGLNIFCQQTSQNLGTGYNAPECTKPSAYTMKSDVYSFGVVMLELLTGRMPFDRYMFLPLEM